MSIFCYEAPAASVVACTGSEIPATAVSVGSCPPCTVCSGVGVILLGIEGTLLGNTVTCVAEN